MKIFLLFFTSFLCLYLISCNQSPKIYLKLKNLSTSKDSIRSFTIYNQGTSTLDIIDFTTSCECTALT